MPNLRQTLITVLLASLTATASGHAQETPPRSAPPTPSPSDQTQTIEKARELAIQYTANLPDFICTETIRRLHLSKGSKSWKPIDTMTLDLSFADGVERHKVTTLNGKPTDKLLDDIGGVTSSGEFGGNLRSIFRAESHAEFHWERWTDLRGRITHVFSYKIEQANSDNGLSYSINSKHGEGSFAYGGLVYVDRETNQVMRITSAVEGIPADWPFISFSSETDYGFAQIGEQKWLLPLHAEAGTMSQDRSAYRNVTEFSSYRKFSAEATIRFEKQ